MTPEELRRWRGAHGYTLAALAAALGVGRQTVWRWEHPEAQTAQAVPPWLPLALWAIEQGYRLPSPKSSE